MKLIERYVARLTGGLFVLLAVGLIALPGDRLWRLAAGVRRAARR